MAMCARPFLTGPDVEPMRLTPAIGDAIRADGRRFVIVGAGGWIGRATLDLLHDALGAVEAQRRVRCFGSQARMIPIDRGAAFFQRPLADLEKLPPMPTLLLHLAFLTKDKVGSMADADYIGANRALSREVHDALEEIGVDRLFVASSGAAAFADDPTAAHDLRLYGSLKREDEDRFAAWALAKRTTRRAVVTRIYNIAGPYINKHGTYALASFILDALMGDPIHVHAPMRVVRGFVAVQELLSLVLAALVAPQGEPVLRFDSGGDPIELADLAARVIGTLRGGPVEREPVTQERANIYVGDGQAYRALCDQFAIEPVPLTQQIAQTAAWLGQTITTGKAA